MKIVLFAKEIVITRQIVNPETGKFEIKKYNSLDVLREHNISFLPMPEDYVLSPAKGDKKEFKLSDHGCYVLATVDDNGVILNEFKGGNLRRPLAIDINTILGLRDLFVGNGKPSDPQANKKK